MATQEISTKNVFGYFVQDKKHERLPQFVSIGESDGEGGLVADPDIRIVASCNQGILCCVKKLKGCNYQYYVGKPSTQQWKAIPNPKEVNDDEPSIIKGIMVLPSSGDSLRFAIVRLTTKDAEDKWKVEYHCEIFDSKYWKWKELGGMSMRTPYEFIVNSPGVSSKSSSVHWLTSEENVVGIQFVEHLDGYKFKYIKTPPKSKNKYMKLVECDKDSLKLGYVILTEEDRMQLWLVTEREIWSAEKVKSLKAHEDQVKFPCHAGFYNVDDDLEDLDKFREIICYEKLLDGDDSSNSNAYTFRLDQLNVAADVFRVRLDFEPINIPPPCPTLSDDAKESGSLRLDSKPIYISPPCPILSDDAKESGNLRLDSEPIYISPPCPILSDDAKESGNLQLNSEPISNSPTCPILSGNAKKSGNLRRKKKKKNKRKQLRKKEEKMSIFVNRYVGSVVFVTAIFVVSYWFFSSE